MFKQLAVTMCLLVGLTFGTFAQKGRPNSTGAVFVTSQGLYYDTFVTNESLPMHGPFQLLDNGTTEFGPGDSGYLGGRWWEDLNGNGQPVWPSHVRVLLAPGIQARPARLTPVRADVVKEMVRWQG